MSFECRAAALSRSVEVLRRVPADTYENSMNGTTTVYAKCAPDLFCADNGAKCETSANCFK